MAFKTSLKSLFLAAALLVAATPAFAAHSGSHANFLPAGFYVGLGAGLSSGLDSDYSAGPFNGRAELDSALLLAGSVGYRVLPNVRLDIEVAHQDHDIGTVTGGIPTAFTAGAEAEVWSFLANAYYDFDIGLPVTPFIGGGVGGAHLNVTAPGGYDQSDLTFAYQGGAGVAYNLSPNVAVQGAYRYFGTLNPDFPTAVGTLDTEYDSHQFLASFRISLN